MSKHTFEIGIWNQENFWLLSLAIILFALALGYVISLDPDWLRIGFEPTLIKHLLGLLVGVAVAITIFRWPEIGLLGLVAVIYTNASEIGVRFHNLPSALQLLVLVLIIILIGRQLVLRGQRLVFDSLIVWLIIYGAVIFASSARAFNLQLADEDLFEHVKDLLIFFVIINFMASRLTLWRVVWTLMLIGAFLGTISVYQVFTSSYGSEFGGFGRIKLAQIVGYIREPRIAGPLSDPNFYAQILVVLVPLALYRVWDESSLRLKAIAAYAFAVTMLALVFTYSRGGALALAIVLLLAAINKKVKVQYLLLGLLVLAPLIILIPKQFEGRLSTLTQLIPGQDESPVHLDSSFQERILLMRTAWEMFSDRPFFGVGAGNYSEYYEEYSPRVGSIVSSYEDFGKPRFPHNLYLEVAAETGLVGLVVFATIIVLTLLRLRSAHKLFKAAGDLHSASLVISLALGFIGYLITSLFLHGDYIRYFWLLVAISVAAKNIAEQQRKLEA